MTFEARPASSDRTPHLAATMMLTSEQLQSILPAVGKAKCQALLPFLNAAMTEFAIQRPARVAAFVAQLAHESGQFRFMEEIWGPTPAQRRYEPPSRLATSLGNTEPGDGKRFKGRGPIQITGRANYRRFGDLLSVDLVDEPARAAADDLAFRIAGLYWSKKGLNELADEATIAAFREITRRINGGLNGLADRQNFYNSACTALGVTIAAAAQRDRAPRTPGEAPPFERGAEAIHEYLRKRRKRKSMPAAPRRKRRRPKTKSRR